MKNQHKKLFPRELIDTSTQSVMARVVFGNPNSNCSGTGICQISINDCFSGEAAPPDCPCLRVTTACVQQVYPGEIRIVITRDQIDATLWLLFRNDQFVIPAAGFRLPQSVQRKLALNGSFVPAGTYEVKRLGRSLAIELTLREEGRPITTKSKNDPK